MAVITGTEKANTGVGRGINMLTAKYVGKDQVSTFKIFNMDRINVESMTENVTTIQMLTENSKVDLAKSLSIDAGLEASAMGFSASVSTQYNYDYTSSTEKAYSTLRTIVKKKRHFFPDTSYKKNLYTEFADNLNGTMSPAALFQRYGTHFIREAGVGGVLTMNLVTTKDKSDTKESLTVKAKANFGKLVSGHMNTEEKKSLTQFLEKSDFGFNAVGGKSIVSLSLDNFFTEYPSWVSSVQSSAAWEFSYLPNDNSLAPIWSLCSSSTRAKQLREYYQAEAAKINSKLVTVETFVWEVRINNESSRNNAKFAQAGFTLVDQDLNEGAKGNWIYLTYQTKTKGEITNAGRKPITNLLLVQSDKALKWNSLRMADGSGKTALYYRIDSDLNKSAGGKYIYLCYTFDTNYAPLTAISAYKDSNRPEGSEWNTVTWNGSNSIADVNKGAGGRYIYILQKHKQ